MLKLAIVCPCYNEESVLESSASRLTEVLDSLVEKGKISPDSFILFVNDGSRDATWPLICSLHTENKYVKGLCLAHNVGHQKAIMAGMMQARTMCDALITMDADLQDELSCIEQMLDKHSRGADVVYGVKVERQADGFVKRKTAEIFYRLLDSFGVETIYNHADFRFMTRRVVDALSSYPEKNLYLRALLPKIGFPSATVEDHLGERTAGKSKYTPGKMIGLAVDGITSFTERPLYFVLWSGLIFLLISLGILVYVLVSLCSGHVTPGWTSLMLSVWFVGGVILLAMGVVGIYIGKIFSEVKGRPLYNVQDFLD